jgi:putative phosphoribosyl transferase
VKIMSGALPGNVYELPELRNRIRVFRDRAQAGESLAAMLAAYRDSAALVFAIPAGGVPVAIVLAERLHLALELAVVSKITLPWNTEAGYGAVAFDGTVRLNEWLLPRLGLSEQEIQKGISKTRAKVARRAQRLRGKQPLPILGGRPVILADDGVASGFTLRTARDALSKAGAERLIVAVPTGHWESVEKLATEVETLYCANIREGLSFAVADAYQHWRDVEEPEVTALLASFADHARP